MFGKLVTLNMNALLTTGNEWVYCSFFLNGSYRTFSYTYTIKSSVGFLHIKAYGVGTGALYKEMLTFEVLLVTRPLTYSTPWIQSKCCQLDERRENMFIQNLSISLKISYSFPAARMFFQVNETTGRSQQWTFCCVRQHLLLRVV